MKNEYFKDAARYIDKAASFIVDEKLELETIESILFFALGMERILKGILYELNPVYVYKNQDFKNTISILYKCNLVGNYCQNQEISKEPNHDVLSFKLSLLRAKAISPTTEKYTSLLFALSNYRDIISHCNLSLLEIDKAQKMLLRDFFPILKAYSSELNIPIRNFIGARERKLVTISAKHQENIEDKVKLKIDSHRSQWDRVKSNTSFVEKMKKRTSQIVHSSDRKRDSFYEMMPCPACENDALILINIDYEYSDGSVTPSGAFVSKLKCLFCHIVIDEYDEIGYLKLDSMLIPEEDFDR